MTTATDPTTQPNLDPETNNSPRIDLPRPLSLAQVKTFVDEGYLVVPGTITRGEIDELLADIIKILRGGYDCPAIKPPPPGSSDQDVMRSFLGLLQPHAVSPIMLRFARHPKICSMLGQLVGAHIPFWDGSVKCMQSMFFTKPPGYPGQAWHQDEIYIPTRDRSLTGAWVALDDATIENGCLYVIPQSHRMGYLYPQRHPHTRPDEWDFAPESYGFDASKAVPVEVKAGDVFFFQGYLLHSSFKNRSAIYRRAAVNHYCNAWSHLPWSLRENESVAMADRRKIIPVAGIDPYAWKGYEPLSPSDAWVRPLK